MKDIDKTFEENRLWIRKFAEEFALPVCLHLCIFCAYSHEKSVSTKVHRYEYIFLLRYNNFLSLTYLF